MNCECIKNVNALLAPRNAQLAMGLQLTGTLDVRGVLLVATEKLDKAKRKPLPPVAAAFCPFCGVSMRAADAGGRTT